MNADLYDNKNKKVGTVELPDGIFGVKWNPALVKQSVLAQLANARRPWAHAKGRGEVRGGGKKPWRQKGTGRSRHGSIRSPIWPGGGVSHGPQKERDYTVKVNRKMKKAALFSALSSKVRSGELFVIKDLGVSEPKTKLMAAVAHAFGAGKGKKSALIVPAKTNANAFRAAKNIANTKALAADSLNVYDVMKHKELLLEEAALETIKKTWSE